MAEKPKRTGPIKEGTTKGNVKPTGSGTQGPPPPPPKPSQNRSK